MSSKRRQARAVALRITAAGRPLTVIVTVSPASTRRTISLAFWRSSLSPTVSTGVRIAQVLRDDVAQHPDAMRSEVGSCEEQLNLGVAVLEGLPLLASPAG